MRKIEITVFLMIVGCLMPLAAQNTNVFTTRIEFQNGEKSLAIIGYNGNARSIVIPTHINGLPVRRIGDSAFKQKRITNVVIPEGIRSIGAQAFFGNQLSRVVIPSSVKEIAPSAFDGNTAKLVVGGGYYNPLMNYDMDNRSSNVVLPAKPENAAPTVSSVPKVSSAPTVSSAPKVSFMQTTSSVIKPAPPPKTPYTPLRQINIYSAPANSGGFNTPGNMAYTGKPSTDVMAVGGVAELNSEYGIGKRAYCNMNLGAVTIPQGTLYIGDSAFLSNNLTSIVIPSSVRHIGSQAFTGNPLTSITIGENVSLQYDSFRYQFSDYYRMNNYMAGTYICKAGQWSFKN